MQDVTVDHWFSTCRSGHVQTVCAVEYNVSFLVYLHCFSSKDWEPVLQITSLLVHSRFVNNNNSSVLFIFYYEMLPTTTCRVLCSVLRYCTITLLATGIRTDIQAIMTPTKYFSLCHDEMLTLNSRCTLRLFIIISAPSYKPLVAHQN